MKKKLKIFNLTMMNRSVFVVEKTTKKNKQAKN
jgi:hypothetical protein